MLFSRGTVTLDCYTTDPYIYASAKIESGTKFYPEWWKKLPTSNKNWQEHFLKDFHPSSLAGTNSMRSCIGFMNVYKNSFVLPMWSDLRLAVSSWEKMQIGFPGVSYQYADFSSNIETHPVSEHGNHFPEEKYQHVKLDSPWELLCDADIQWAWMPPVWHFMNELEDITIVNGVLDYFHQTTTNVNMFVKRPKKEESFFEIPYGTPLCHIIPLTERTIKLRHHLVTQSELMQIKANRGVKARRYFGSAYFKSKSKKGLAEDV